MEMIYEDVLDDIECIEPVPDDDDVTDGLFPDLTDMPTDFSRHGAGISVTLRSMEAGNRDGFIGALSGIVHEVDYVVGSCFHVQRTSPYYVWISDGRDGFPTAHPLGIPALSRKGMCGFSFGMRPFFRTPFGALRFIWNMGRVISAVDANEFEVGAVLYDSEANMVGSFVSMNRNLIENLVKKAQPFIDYRGDDPIMAPNKIAIQGTARYSRALCCPGGHTDEGYREAIGKLYAIIKKPWK